ncbi:hypothetical protein AWC38_SpisGene18611 [Stylophora pistillata]|uniref:Uncharacterized protein n=2 Tax=Stylophora pistillata TaxID=50429 RepID=A0A2B4RJU7_STYPI|nr:hypothetical protein AWC38_SpisGene18611 [Stylophora pistillata]
MAAEVDRETLKAENDRLRHTLFVMVADRQKMASKLTGVQNLGQQLQKKDMEIGNLREKIERLEGSLARAENRITQLSLQAGNGQHLSGQTAIVTPGVSKKVLEALTRDNTRLKQALDHLTNRGPAGVDLAVENKELHEIIMTLRDERDMKSNEVNELKTALAAVQEGNIELLKGQVLRLTALVTKLERNLNAKQVFCETVVTENESLKNELQSLRDDTVTRVRDLKRGLGQQSTHPDVRRILNQASASNSEELTMLTEEVSKLNRENRELEAKASEREHLIVELNRSKEEGATSKDLHTAQLKSYEEEQARFLQQLHALSDELTATKRDCAEKEIQLKDNEMEQELMRNALEGYENDFKMERQEKVKALSDREQASRESDQIKQRFEQLRQEHIGLRQNIEQMYANAQRQQAQGQNRLPNSGRSCAAQVQEPWQKPNPMRPRALGMEVQADGTGPDVTDSPTSPRKDAIPPMRRFTSQGSQLQCPNCRKLFPHDLLENHMRDCTGDD